MNSLHKKSDRFILTLSFFVFLIFPLGCGAVGPPIPPENIGIEATIRKQQRENAQSEGTLSQDRGTLVEEEAVELPTFYPIGTR
jgi:hypothetical protein